MAKLAPRFDRPGTSPGTLRENARPREAASLRSSTSSSPYRDAVNGLTDLYLSSLSNRTNEVMRLPTVVSSIFIPLTFIAGICGMNFDPGASPFTMPELGAFLGYPTVMVVMLLVGGGMAHYFKRRGWL
jgi:magnesium transporter